ncbi:MAG: hypothetical protein WC413_02290 [Candidatus Nanoarchaeia archaeon]
MKTLVIFYSRTGTTKKIAENISKKLKCDIEEIFDCENRVGVKGYIKSGKQATLKKLTKLKDTNKDPSIYDLVIIGTPIWAWNMCCPIRTYITKNKEHLRKVAFFCTMGGSGANRTFKCMEKLCNKKSVACLKLKTKDVINNNYSEKVKEFTEKLNPHE